MLAAKLLHLSDFEQRLINLKIVTQSWRGEVIDVLM